MSRLPHLVEVTPEGRIIAALIEGPQSYTRLRSATKLSHRWLSKKLKKLSSSGLIEHDGNNYQLRNPTEMINADPVFAQYLRERVSLKTKARMIAEEISRDERVVAAVLFGSVAKELVTEESDIDLLVVTEADMGEELNSMVYDLMFKYDVPVEAVFLTYEDLIVNLHAESAFSLGLFEGYRVLYDRGGLETLLSIKKKEIQRKWIFDQEAQAWIQRRLILTSKPQKTS